MPRFQVIILIYYPGMKNIALAMSGGGFRAAAFSLGTLSYLNHLQYDGKPLLQNVTFIGSTSGGSFTSIAYTLGLYEGKEFSEIYREMLEAMDGEQLIASVFKILKDPRKWKGRKTKSRNLINAFSIAYDDFFQHKEFNTLFKAKEGISPHIKEICINSTEFTNGLSFRFQSQRKGMSRGKIGNNYIYFKDGEVGGRLLLGDLMACSSCFSGGFEPFIFPDDFVHHDLDRKTLSDSLVFKDNPFKVHDAGQDAKKDLLPDDTFNDISNRFGLMDGGVADNQAIDSILRANSRRDGKEFDLIILSDVSSYFVNGYTLPLEKKSWYSFLTVQFAINVLKFLAFIPVILLIWSLAESWQRWMWLALIPGAIAATIYLYGRYQYDAARKKAEKEKSTWMVVLFHYVSYFFTVRYSRLKQMVTARLKSVFLLTNDLYLKQIRRLYYQKIYNDPVLRDMTVSNAIYDLSKAKEKAQNDPEQVIKEVHYKDTLVEPDLNEIPAPLPALVDVAEKARLMPTTLWFDQFQKEEETLKAIVATGQFTICYNLLKYLVELSGRAELSKGQLELKALLMADWNTFNANPFDLYNKL